MAEEKEKPKQENPDIDEKQEKLVDAEISEEMQKAYIDYAMSVIVARALPAVEDGLKPVQRRILYAMDRMGLQPNKQTKKCARIVGDVIGKYHPHGDTAAYDALVRMAQDFSLRYPLIKGQGNFGSIDNDPPAAYRYTEAKLASISSELLQDIDKQTVKFIPNFDNSLKEPVILPAKLPNLLINGATGIAVGMTTSIPPHNLGEVIDATVEFINKPDVKIEKLAEIIKGPDFPTGGYIVSDNINQLYTTGKASLTVRGKTIMEESKSRRRIVITEIPYQLNKTDLITEIARLIENKKLPDVSDLRDESSKGKIRIIIELKKGADPKFTTNRLYQYTRLQTRFDAVMIALVAGQPKMLTLKDIIREYVNYRKQVVTKRCKFELTRAEDRQHLVEGLLKALKQLDEVIAAIKKSSNATEALATLQKKFSLSQKQAQAILETRLQQLTALEQNKLKKEHEDLKKAITELKKILGSEKEILGIIKKELSELKRKYADARRTYILSRIAEIKEKDLIAKKEVVITITDKGYVKRIGLKAYHEQKRGGKGVIGAELATGDFVKQIITCNTHDYMLFFTSRGKIYWLKAYEVPEIARYGKGKALINLLNLRDESVTAVIAVKKFENSLIMATCKGMVKKISLQTFSKPRKTGVRAINLPHDDLLIDVQPITNEEIMLVTKQGQAIRFNSQEVREMGRASYGVTGIKLDKNDDVVSLEVLPLDEAERKKSSILTITNRGYGKRSTIDDYRKTGRAGKGVINIKTSEKTGTCITTISVKQDDSIIVTTAKGMVIRVPVKGIRIMGRATQGVRIIKLQEADKVTDLIKINSLEE